MTTNAATTTNNATISFVLLFISHLFFEVSYYDYINVRFVGPPAGN